MGLTGLFRGFYGVFDGIRCSCEERGLSCGDGFVILNFGFLKVVLFCRNIVGTFIRICFVVWIIVCSFVVTM